jgi:hypothetical protein
MSCIRPFRENSGILQKKLVFERAVTGTHAELRNLFVVYSSLCVLIVSVILLIVD